MKTELSHLQKPDLSALDDEDRKAAIRQIETMLGEIVDHLESGGYQFQALALSKVIKEITKGNK